MIYLISILHDQTHKPAFVTFNEDFVEELKESRLGKSKVLNIKEIPMADRAIDTDNNGKGG